MAKFCTKCGKELVDGKCLDCGKESPKKEVVETKKGFDFNECVNNYIEALKGMFTKPIDTVKKFSKAKYFTLGMIALIISCIVTGIFIYCLLNEITGSLGVLSLAIPTGDLPFMRVFLYGVLFSVVQYAVLGFMIYLLAAKLFKDNIDIKSCFALIGVCSIFTTVTTLVGLICIYLSMTVMLIVLVLASLLNLLYLYHGLVEVTKVDKNRIAYVLVGAQAVASFIVLYVLPKLLS